jgi:hypothetical protein
MAAHSSNSSTLEDKTRGLKIRDQPGLQNETLSKTNKQTKKKKTLQLTKTQSISPFSKL